jgi:carbamate kinase
MRTALIAIGGNSLIRDNAHPTVADQYVAVCETVRHIAAIIARGYRVIITHGNGPQVGFILRRSEIACEVGGMHPVPLVSCGADTQGAIGYQIQQAMDNEFLRRGILQSAVSVVTQTVVSADDPAFRRPSKPIGSFFNQEQAEALQKKNPDWIFLADAGRGYRRVVPSPLPVRIVERQAIADLVGCGYCVVAAGGGGIPVFQAPDGTLQGVDAVIDKDRASSLLATEIGVDTLIISTAVPKVYLNFGRPDQQPLDCLTVCELEQYAAQGHFAPGSMLPKIEAVIQFLKQGGEEAIITNPESLEEAVAGNTGTHVRPR